MGIKKRKGTGTTISPDTNLSSATSDGTSLSNQVPRFAKSCFLVVCLITMMMMWGNNVIPSTKSEDDVFTSAATTKQYSADSSTTRFGLLVKEMKQKVEDHCQLLQSNETASQEILDTAWRSHLKPWMNGMKYPFDLIVHKNDAGGPFKEVLGGHISQIVSQLAGTIREANATKPAGTPIGAFDIGVNYGWATFTMASMDIDVYSFEPMQSNVRFLRTALCLSPPEIRSRVTLFDFGLSNKEQECRILSVDGNIGDGQVVCHEDKEEKAATLQAEHAAQKGQAAKFREIVRLRRLDDVLPKNEEADSDLMSKIVVIKMDTEGHEPFLVEGGKGFFRKFRPKVVHSEFDHRQLKSVHADAKGMMSFFIEELGYTVRENRAHHIKRVGKGPMSKEFALTMSNFDGLHDLIFERQGQ